MADMEEGKMKIFEVDFTPLWPVGGCLIIAANNIEEATEIAKKTITHTQVKEVREIAINEPKVIIYQSGDY